ncbi:tripartite tricarboxylate transporter permease [Yanshouia hominis]|nr:tripartite tricarboxylate transporter permease [Yanshouia hominis]
MLEILLEIIAPGNLLMMNLGMAAGIIIGALPGLSVILAITVLLPFTFGMSSLPGMFLLLGAYCGATYGGSITAILINTPGTPNAAATVLDGYPMAQQGRAGDALKAALVGSTFGGMVSCLALIFLAPLLAQFALKFGPAEYFSLCIFGLSVVISISGGSIAKGVVMAGLGLLLSTVGIDPLEGISRFRFGRSELLGGITTAALLLGVFAVGEILMKSYAGEKGSGKILEYQKATVKIRDIFRYWKTMLHSSFLGVFIGAVPGTGGAIAAFLSYNITRSRSKRPEEFGNGCLEGVVAPETANNAVTGATLIPLLTLGVPGDAGMAVMFGALTMQGITPGPALFTDDKFWVCCIMGGLILINLFMLLQGSFFLRLFTNVTRVPVEVLIPCIMIFCTLGGFSVRNMVFDIAVVLICGFFGYWMKRFGYPLSPLVISLVLGSLTETNLRRAMVLSKGSISIFFAKPLSLTFLIIAVLILCMPLIKRALSAGKSSNRRGVI